jgi:hypothetical protein
MKLKALLEGYAWERTPGKGLPTLAEVEAQYRKKLTEDDDFIVPSGTIKDELTTLSAVCEKCKSDLDAALTQVQIGSVDAKNAMQNNAMLLMNAICTYISDIQSLHEQNPEYSMDDVVVENALQILSTNIKNYLEY